MKKKPRTPIILLNSKKEIVSKFISMYQASQELKISKKTIRKAILSQKPVGKGRYKSPCEGMYFRTVHKRHFSAMLRTATKRRKRKDMNREEFKILWERYKEFRHNTPPSSEAESPRAEPISEEEEDWKNVFGTEPTSEENWKDTFGEEDE